MRFPLRSFAILAAALFLFSGVGAAGQSSAPAPAPTAAGDTPTPRIEWFVGYSNFRSIPMGETDNRIAWLSGGSSSLAINANRYWGLVFDGGYYRASQFGPGAPPTGGVVSARGNAFSIMVGPRLSFRGPRFTPFVQALFGEMDPRQVNLTGCSGVGCTPLPTESSFGFNAGGGLDLNLSRHFALRLFQVEYAMTRFRDPTTTSTATTGQNDARLSTGIVFRFGGNQAPAPVAAAPQPPMDTCSADAEMVTADSGGFIAVSSQASDPGHYPLTYTWTATGGAVEGSGRNVRWNPAGVAAGNYTVNGHVDNGRGGTADCVVNVRVAPRPNRPPSLVCVIDRGSMPIGSRARITAAGDSPDHDTLTYSWQTPGGGRIVGDGAAVAFDSAGLEAGSYTIHGHVDDGQGGAADCSVAVNVDAAVVAPPVALAQALALHSIYFPTDQPGAATPDSGLEPSQQAILATLAADFTEYLQFKPDAHLTLEGHADERASQEYNQALAERRVALSKRFLVEHGVPEANVDTRSFGKHEELDAAEVRKQMEANPELGDAERQAMFAHLPSIILAQNRRVDVVLSGTGQQSTRDYPFNAKDALTLLNDAALNH